MTIRGSTTRKNPTGLMSFVERVSTVPCSASALAMTRPATETLSSGNLDGPNTA